jgi:2,3-bisphosphoglycerate-independent phosphoglycerate mutase
VPLVLTDASLAVRDGGGLSDLAPTVLALLGLATPPEMTGRSLLTDAVP